MTANANSSLMWKMIVSWFVFFFFSSNHKINLCRKFPFCCNKLVKLVDVLQLGVTREQKGGMVGISLDKKELGGGKEKEGKKRKKNYNYNYSYLSLFM